MKQRQGECPQQPGRQPEPAYEIAHPEEKKIRLVQASFAGKARHFISAEMGQGVRSLI
jgi:hypothetical protein